VNKDHPIYKHLEEDVKKANVMTMLQMIYENLSM
jgi:hypothetical protein